MATTETRTGFRLPWNAESRSSTEAPQAEASQADAPAEPDTDTTEAPSGDAPAADAGTAAVEEAQDTMSDPTTVAADATPSTTGSGRKPTKFQADLTKAMRVAAETERAEILNSFKTDAKAFAELVHERSATESAALRKQADDDIGGIREWSKAEIARIREETDERIAHRRGRLDREVEDHAARIERQVEQVNRTVDGFEAEMARFFEELVSEEDPTRFAALAGHLPEPPSLDDALAHLADVEPPAARAADEMPGPDVPAAVATAETSDATEPEPVAGTIEAPAAHGADDGDPTPAATADTAWPTEDDVAPRPAEAATAESTAEAAAGAEDAELDPRVAALGLTPDFAAAEAEALEGVEADASDGSVEDGPSLDEDAIAARLADLVPPAGEGGDEAASTQVIVTGLVSVASIAGFKRHLGRLSGVKSVGVSSGPDGEFVFAVTHDSAFELRDAIPTLPTFAARVTGGSDGTLTVTARDPESES
jgi:hypothetical protein